LPLACIIGVGGKEEEIRMFIHRVQGFHFEAAFR